jgi:DNA repair exonuclease SbcCD ATPase subunit
MHNSIGALTLIEEHLDTSVLPIAIECKTRYDKYIENKANLVAVKRELSEIDMGERLPIFFELDPFMCVFICMTLAMVFVLPAVLISYWFFVLEVIPVILALDHFVIKLGAFYYLYRLFGGKKLRPVRKVVDRKSSLEEVEVREAIERLKYEKELATDEFMQSRAEFLSSVRQYRLWADRVSPLLEAEGFSILPDIAEEDVLKTVVTQAKEIVISEEALREVERSTRCLKLEKQGLARELQDMIYSKGCENFKDLQENYMRMKASTKNKSAVSSLKMKLSDRRARLCKIASVYEFSMTAEKALSLFSKLKSGYTDYERKLREVEYKASGMGLADSSLEYLEDILGELEEKRVLLKDSPEYLKASWEKVKEEDYGNRLLELQKNIQTPTRSIEQVDRDMKEAREHITEMVVKYKALSVALEVMNESIEEMNTEFGPALNIATGKILSSITNGAYKNALVSKELDVSVKDGVLYRASDYLSNGSIDQVYLALRLALCDVAVKEGVYPPAFLDDILMQYDDERTLSCLEFLDRYSKEKSRQMILFTCHGNVVDRAKQIGLSIENAKTFK